jgi:hypothetical protein
VNEPAGSRARARFETDAGKLPSVRGLGLTWGLSPKGSSEEPSFVQKLGQNVVHAPSVLDQSIPEPKHQRKVALSFCQGRDFGS